jgi:serine/threonine protein kinase
MSKERRDREFKPGERIPGSTWIVIRLLAKGGHGALYLVRHAFLKDKIMVLKTLRSVEPSAQVVERFGREMQVLAGMRHPHVIVVVDGGMTEGLPWYVMEYLRGCSLATIMEDAPHGVGIDVALQILIELCDALAYVHELGVIHRDIKPDNVFLQRADSGPGSITKLLDFGVSHLLESADGKRLTDERSFVGTFQYAAPETLRSGAPPLPQTDLYSLGVVAYEIVTGRHPFEDWGAGLPAKEAHFAVAKAHLERQPPPFPPFPIAPCPEGLEEIVQQMLRKQPEARPRSAEWVAAQLRQLVRLDRLASAKVDPNQTQPSPAQNALTATRAEATDPGKPLDEEAGEEKIDPDATGAEVRSSAETPRYDDKATVAYPLRGDPNETVEDVRVPLMSTHASRDPLTLTSPSKRLGRDAGGGRWETTVDPPNTPPDALALVSVPSPSVPLGAQSARVDSSLRDLPDPGIDRRAATRSPAPAPGPFRHVDTLEISAAGAGDEADTVYRDSELQSSELPRRQSLAPRPSAAPLVASPRPACGMPVPNGSASASSPAVRLMTVTTSNGVSIDRPWLPSMIRLTRRHWAVAVGAVGTILLVAVAAHFASRPSTMIPAAVASVVPSVSAPPAAQASAASAAMEVAPPAAMPAAASAVASSESADPSPAAVSAVTPSSAPPTRPRREKSDVMRSWDSPPAARTSPFKDGPLAAPSTTPKRPGPGL